MAEKNVIMLNVIECDEELKDFNCPHCKCALENTSSYLGNITELVKCPKCGKNIEITMVEHISYNVFVSKPSLTLASNKKK
jgi:predicted Zn finger-like uncharacterized protein